MEREIKFRAWDANFQTMITPYCELIDGYFWGEDCTNTGYSVKHEHVMQYTGFKDDNNIEIYEGDVIIFGSQYGSTSEVKFLQDNGGFLVKDKYGDWKWLYDAIGSTNCNIIGNIYANPELLK